MGRDSDTLACPRGILCTLKKKKKKKKKTISGRPSISADLRHKLRHPMALVAIHLVAAWSPPLVARPTAARAYVSATVTNDPSTYDTKRALNIFSELASRSAGMLISRSKPGGGNGDGASSGVKSAILDLLTPYGDPALSVPDDVFQQVDSRCRELERLNPNSNGAAAINAMQGTWKVRYSDAPPPSNGALGPVRGRAFQVVDVPSRT